MFDATCAANASCISIRSICVELDARPLERLRHGERGPHQQLSAGIDGGHGPGAHERQRLAALGARLLLGHQQHRRRAVGQRRGVAGGDAAVPLVEGGRQRGERLERGVPAQQVVAAHRVVARRDEHGAGLLAEPAVLGRRPGVPVRGERDPVLLVAGDAVLLRHLLGGLAHREARRGLGHGRPLRHQVPRAERRQDREPRPHRPRALALDERPRQPAAQRDRDVRQRLGATGDAGVEVPQANLGRDVRDRLAGGRAGAVHRVRRDFLRQAGPEPHLTGEVRSLHRGHHLSHHDGADRGRVHLGPLQQLPDAGLAQLDGAQVPKRGPGASEGRAASGDDGDSAIGHWALGGGRPVTNLSILNQPFLCDNVDKGVNKIRDNFVGHKLFGQPALVLK